MEESNTKQLSQIAHVISGSAQEAAKITQDIILASKAADLTLDKIYKDLSCFADHCSLLSDQLRDAGGLEIIAAKNTSDKYWKCVDRVLQLWHTNMVETVERVQKNQGLRSMPTSWILSSNVLSRWDPRMWSVEAAAESYTQDVQLVTALLNL